MAEFKAKMDDLDGLLNSIQYYKDAISTSVTAIKEPSVCQDIMLSEYVQTLRDISKLLDKYKELLNKDIADIRNAKSKIQEMDTQMVNLSKSS